MTTDKICEFCEEAIKNNDYYSLYAVKVETETEERFIGIDKILSDLGDYCMTRNYHLSSSQILLLRPDVLKKYCEENLGLINILSIELEQYTICYDCFEQFKEKVPLI